MSYTLQEIVNHQAFDEGFRETLADIKAGIPIAILAFNLTQRRPSHPTEEWRHRQNGKWAAIKEAEKEASN